MGSYQHYTGSLEHGVSWSLIIPTKKYSAQGRLGSRNDKHLVRGRVVNTEGITKGPGVVMYKTNGKKRLSARAVSGLTYIKVSQNTWHANTSSNYKVIVYSSRVTCNREECISIQNLSSSLPYG